MASAGDRFTILPKSWYAWHMLPGYVDDGQFCPYQSPIYVEQIRPRKSGAGLFDVTLVNAAYTEGVQRFELVLHILRRGSTYAVASIGGEPDRTAIVGEISFAWLRKQYPDWWATVPADSMPEPFRSDVQAYLERRLGLLHE